MSDLHPVEQARRRAEEVLGRRRAEEWLRTPRPELQDRSPIDAVLDGDEEDVATLLIAEEIRLEI